jgi:hypothetical protein
MNKFIQQATILYMAVVILLKMMAMPISMMDYSLNKGFISENLCENRLNPEMHCAGKCYLSKKLKKGNDSQESTDQKGGIKIAAFDFFEPAVELSFSCDRFTPVPAVYWNTSCISSQYKENLLRPPIV